MLSFNIGTYAAHDAQELARLLGEARADIICLQELVWIENQPAVTSLMQTLQTPYSAIGMSINTQNHTLVLSRYPILQSYTLTELQNSGLIAKIETNLGCITLAAIHLATSPEKSRLKELSQVLGIIDDPSAPFVIIGDLNAISKGDPVSYSAAPEELPTYDVTETIKKAGFTDTGYESSTVFTPTVSLTRDAGIEYHNLRLDYIYVNRALSNHKFEYHVLATDNPYNLSDHLPIVTTVY